MEGCGLEPTETVESPWVKIFQNRLDAIPCHVLRDGSACSGSLDGMPHRGPFSPDPSCDWWCRTAGLLFWFCNEGKRQLRIRGAPEPPPGGAGSAGDAQDGPEGAWERLL